MKVSVVLPVYNSKQIAKVSIATLCRFLQQHFQEYEVIIIDDGSSPTQKIETNDLPLEATLVRNERNQGKGKAVKLGMKRAKGECRIFTDIDLPYELEAIITATEIIDKKESLCVVGDRYHPQSVRKGRQPWGRHSASILFRKTISFLILGEARDTQCGFKAFQGDLAERLFLNVTTNRFAFDLEIFAWLKQSGISTHAIPVKLNNSQISSVRLWGDGWQMVKDVFKIWKKYHLF